MADHTKSFWTGSIVELIRDLMVTYILTKFGANSADWLIFVDAKM